MQTPWLGLFGADDESIPAEDVDAIEAAVASAPVSTEVQVYANAGHAFLNDTRPDRHVPEVADQAWSRTLTWFDERDGNQEVYVIVGSREDVRSGREWSARRVTNTPGQSIGAYLAWNGPTIGLAWCDDSS